MGKILRLSLGFLLLLGAATFFVAASGPTAADLLAAADKEKAAGNWEAAVKAYEAARQASAEAQDKKSEASALVGMSDAEYHREHYERAGSLAAQALGLAKETGALATEADALKLMGNVSYEKGDPIGGEIGRGERLLEIRELLGDRPGVAVALNNMGTSYQETDPLRAIEYYERSQKEFEALGDPRRATVIKNIADEYGVLGDNERALEYSGQAMALAEKSGNERVIGLVEQARGAIETFRGEYPSALASLERAMSIYRKGDFQWGVAEVLTKIGLVYQAQQNHAQAIDYLEQSLALNRKLGDKRLQAEDLTSLARESLALGREAEGETRYREALEILRKTSVPWREAQVLTGLGKLDARRGRRQEATDEVNEAISLERSMPDRRDLADSLVQLGLLQLDARPSVALETAKEATESAGATENWEALWQARLVAGKALRRLRRPAEAAAEFDAAITTIEGERTRIAGPAGSQPMYFADKLEPYQERVALSIAGGEIDDALRIVEQSKSRVLYDVLRSGRTPLDRSLSSDERRKEQDFENELISLNLRIEKQPDNSDARRTRDEKRRELEAFQTTLYARHSELAFQRGAAPALPVGEMSRLAAQTGAVVLDYFVTPDRTYLFLMSPGKRARVRTLKIRRADLDRRASELRRQLASHDLAYAGSAQQLYRLLIAPAGAELAAASSVIVVPDGPLWSVPFAALQSRPGRFWIEDSAISYAPSLAVLRETRRIERAWEKSPAPRELLALGNPKTSSPALPEAERQVREIGNLYGAGRSEILVGEDASEHRFKREASGFRVLHLASHAVLDDVNPMYSHILLAAGNGEDGLLEARKLMDLDLHAEMLVLSACETARGDAPGGEGVSGMLWAAFVAGSPTTVASLWRVESGSTSELMIEFHRKWLASRGNGLPFAKAGALRAAARKLIASGRYTHPFYWAGFILAGSPG